MTDSRRRHPFRRLVLVGTQHDSIPPTELDQVRDTALDGSDTDIAEPPAVAESDTESLGQNSDVAGGKVPVPSTQSETEVVIPVPPKNNRGFSAGLRHLDEFSLVDVFQRRAHVMVCAQHYARGLRIRCPCGLRRNCCCTCRCGHAKIGARLETSSSSSQDVVDQTEKGWVCPQEGVGDQIGTLLIW